MTNLLADFDQWKKEEKKPSGEIPDNVKDVIEIMKQKGATLNLACEYIAHREGWSIKERKAFYQKCRTTHKLVGINDCHK